MQMITVMALLLFVEDVVREKTKGKKAKKKRKLDKSQVNSSAMVCYY